MLDRLKAENEALLARVKELEEQVFSTPHPPQPQSQTSNLDTTTTDADGNPTALVPRASYESQKKEAEDLKVALAQKEKRLSRLREVYTNKSTEFREAIESILGYKLAFYPNGQVRLTSVYDLNTAVVFQPVKEPQDKDKGKENGKAEVQMGGDGAMVVPGGMKMQIVGLGEGVHEEIEGLVGAWLRKDLSIPCMMSSLTIECYEKQKEDEKRRAQTDAGFAY